MENQLCEIKIHLFSLGFQNTYWSHWNKLDHNHPLKFNVCSVRLCIYRSAGLDAASSWSNSSSVALWEMKPHDTPANLPTRHHYLNMGCFTIFVQCMRESVNHYSSVEWPNPSGSRKCSHFSCVTNRKSVDKCVHLLCYPMRVICVKFCSTGEDKDAVESTNIIPANIDSPTKHTILSQCSCFS